MITFLVKCERCGFEDEVASSNVRRNCSMGGKCKIVVQATVKRPDQDLSRPRVPLGDWVAIVAEPIATLLGFSRCSCNRRRKWLNELCGRKG